MTDNLLTSDVPDKFKDAEGNVRLEALLQSYKELEKKLSSQPAVPKSPEEYCINCDHGLFAADADVNTKLHGMGMTQAQAQGVYDLAAVKMMPAIAAMAAEYQADREVEKLLSHFGGPEQWKEVSRQLLAFGQNNLPPDVLDSLSSSYEGILALYRMMQSDEPGIQKTAGRSNSADEMDLQAMMRDPKYWRDRDPAYVAKVTDGFKRMYGE